MKRRHLNMLLLFLTCVSLCMKLTKSAPASAENKIEEESTSFIATYAQQRIKSLMNTSVDACDDFYSYACGNYPNDIVNLETPLQVSQLAEMMFGLYDKMENILEKTRDPSEQYYEELQIAKKFVNTCGNASLFAMEPSEEYLEVIKAIGGFPAIDLTWDESTFDWFNMTAHLTRYGIVGLVEESISSVYPFKPYYKLPKLGFGFDVYLENIATNKSEGYVYNVKIMRNLLQVYNVSRTNADKVIEGIFELWREVLELQAPLTEEEIIRSKCAGLSLIHDLPTSFHKWINLFKIAWDVPQFSISYTSYCPCDWFYNKLDLLAKKKSKAFANYMALKFLFSMHPQLESSQFQRKKCIAIVKAAMPIIFSHFYMKEHYNRGDEDHILEMISELKASWNDLINTADWLNDAAHDEALAKLKNLRSRIGQVVDPTSDVYIKQIKSLHPADNVALNNLQLARFNEDMRHYGHLHQNENKNTTPYDHLDAVKIRAFYMILENNINVLGGLFHPPVYHKDFPNSIKYGSLGYIIGHEIAHGFGGIGFKIDSNLRHRSWLSQKSMAMAKQRSSCFVNDYNNYKDPAFGRKLNGKIVLSEIEADSLGLRQAFEAYRKVLKYGVKHKGEEFLRKEYVPGLNMSREQIFFLSFAQVHCAKYEPKHYWNKLNAKHPLYRYRVMGTLRNNAEFSKAFNCPANSPMNPTEKCRLW